ncbi:MAG: hypothetical protein WCT99_05680 [Bacteroidota bacterium]
MRFSERTTLSRSLRLAALMLLVPLCVSAEEPPRDSLAFRIVAEVGAGYFYKLNTPKAALGAYTRDGFGGTFRLKWGSSNLIGVGIETGWFPISSTKNSSYSSEFGTIDLQASLHALPLLFIFSMQRYGLQLHAGIGYYLVTSEVTVMGETMQSSEWDMGVLLALGYAVPVSDNLRIGAEMKWNNISEQQISVGSLQVRMIYRLADI